MMVSCQCVWLNNQITSENHLVPISNLRRMICEAENVESYSQSMFKPKGKLKKEKQNTTKQNASRIWSLNLGGEGNMLKMSKTLILPWWRWYNQYGLILLHSCKLGRWQQWIPPKLFFSSFIEIQSTYITLYKFQLLTDDLIHIYSVK